MSDRREGDVRVLHRAARGDLNPRVGMWLMAHGLPAETIEGVNGGVRRVEVEGVTLPWTVHFMLWVQARWAEYRKALGLSRAALVSHDAFDAWLEEQILKD